MLIILLSESVTCENKLLTTGLTYIFITQEPQHKVLCLSNLESNFFQNICPCAVHHKHNSQLLLASVAAVKALHSLFYRCPTLNLTTLFFLLYFKTY